MKTQFSRYGAMAAVAGPMSFAAVVQSRLPFLISTALTPPSAVSTIAAAEFDEAGAPFFFGPDSRFFRFARSVERTLFEVRFLAIRCSRY